MVIGYPAVSVTDLVEHAAELGRDVNDSLIPPSDG